MTKSNLLRLSLLSGCAAILGGAGLFTFAAARNIEPEILTRTTTPTAASTLPAVFDAAICRSPRPSRGMAGLLRFAQVEMSPGTLPAVTPAPEFADSDPPLWDGLGTTGYKITTADAQAQAYFNQGLRLTYAFNHDEARRAFRKAQRLDPNCAMCFWGEALVLGPNINMPMQEDAVAPAYAAIRHAQALAGKATPREQALILALATRYSPDPKADRVPLDAAYAAAVGKVATQFPDDNDIAVLHAEAMMDLSPWDYWEPGGSTPRPQSAAIVPTLERVLAKDPDHIGAIHLYIHAVEASDRPQRAELYADRMRGVVPGAGHLVHMPSHIYFRVGRYLDALADNKKAAAVDEAYLAASKAPMGVYRLGYYPHNVHFVMASAQMSGDGTTVIGAAEKLRSIIPDEVARGLALVHPVKAAPYFAHAQFSAPAAILALPDPGDGIPYVKAMWHYARGVAQAAQREFAAAKAEAEAIAEIERSADFSLLTVVGIPAPDVLKLARTVIAARIAQAQGDTTTAVARFTEAAALQDTLPYTEPPYWYYPVRQSLGAALLQAGRLADAEEQFRLALKKAPNNGWTYFGLVELYKARGGGDAMRQAEAQLAKTWIGDRGLLKLSNL